MSLLYSPPFVKPLLLSFFPNTLVSHTLPRKTDSRYLSTKTILYPSPLRPPGEGNPQFRDWNYRYACAGVQGLPPVPLTGVSWDVQGWGMMEMR